MTYHVQYWLHAPRLTNETLEKAFVGPSKNTDAKKKRWKGNCQAFCVTRDSNNSIQLFAKTEPLLVWIIVYANESFKITLLHIKSTDV